MPLAGTFDVLDFGEVLGLLAKRSCTGRLTIRTGSMTSTIWLAEGRATSAETSGGAGEARRKWRALVEDICFDALRSGRGSFEFQPEEEVAMAAGPRVRLETVVAAGRKRLEMWREVESVIHSFEAVPRLADKLPEESLTLDQAEWRALVALDGRRNISSLARRLDIDLLVFCQMLKPLVESGAVVLDQPDGWLKSLPKVRLDPATVEGDWLASEAAVAPATVAVFDAVAGSRPDDEPAGAGGPDDAAKAATPARGLRRRLRSRPPAGAPESPHRA